MADAQAPRLTVESDGTIFGTRVCLPDGTSLPVISVVWEAGPGLAEPTITIKMYAFRLGMIKVIGRLDQITVVEEGKGPAAIDTVIRPDEIILVPDQPTRRVRELGI